MHAFTRIAALAFVLISLSFLVSAMPTVPRTLGAIQDPTGTDAVSTAFAKLCIDFNLEAKIKALVACGTIAELTAATKILGALFKGCAEDLATIGADVSVTVEAKASIVACICSIITLLVEVCAQVSIKFGITVVAALFAQIDVVLRLLLVNLNICVGGILVLIAKAIASATVDLLAQAQLKLCLSVLGLARVGL
ncbi:hypothetical protein FRC07_001747 [Ceratobasidium sp. 392]|nr:hypothetical protein FRC07_001747 [Ceratobasidium sp. 392]